MEKHSLEGIDREATRKKKIYSHFLIMKHKKSPENKIMTKFPPFLKGNLQKHWKQPLEVFYIKKVFLEISQNSQENTCGKSLL